MLQSIALLGVSVGACGDAGRHTGSAPESFHGAHVEGVSSAAPRGGYLRGDGDVDDADGRDEDNYRISHYGHVVSAAQERAIATLVRRYYAAGVAGDGATACSLIYPSLANSPSLGEAAEAAYPPAPGVPPLRGESCARIMSSLFKEDHRRLAADIDGMEVTSMRVKGNKGVVLLGFRTTPERQIPVRRRHARWKIDALLDEELP
jgi:hypothetical protein